MTANHQTDCRSAGDQAAKPIPGLPELLLSGRFAANRDVNWHAHDGTELVLVTRGRCDIRLRETGHPRLAGVAIDDSPSWMSGRLRTLFVLPARVRQYQRSRGMTHTSYVIFRAPPSLFPAHARVIEVPKGDAILVWMEQLCDLPESGAPAMDEATGSGLLLACLARILQLESNRSRISELHPAVVKAMSIIEQRTDGLLDATTIASAAGVSVTHLTALFRAQLGVPPLRYFRQHLMKRAVRLLRNPYARVKEVAQECGYADVNHFIRVFRSQYSVSPGEWRRRHTRADMSDQN